MNRIIKSVVLFIAIALSVFIQTSSSSTIIPVTVQNNHGFDNSYSLSKSEIPGNYYLSKPESNSGNQIIDRTLPVNRLFSSRISSYGLLFEIRLASYFSKYIYYSITITRSLSVRDIVFPFHYFW
jgi:hypothetical protein